MRESDSLGGRVGLIRVIIADNTAMGAQLLADALRRSHRFGTVWAATRAREVLALAADQSVDVALLSVELEDEPGRGFKLAQELSAARPGIKVVFLLDVPNPEAVVQAFRAGGQGVFCRAHSVKELMKCIACVHHGQIWANSQELGFVMGALRDHQPLRVLNRAGVSLLTPREMAVVHCVAEGLTNREAAQQLKLSEHTVKNYMFRIFDKLGVSTRVELILYVASQLQRSSPNGNGKPATAEPAPEPATEPLAGCRRAAERGEGAAQFRLGQAYRDGDDLPMDRVAAYMWFLLAERCDRDLSEAGRVARAHLAPQMTPDQVAEARRRASAWSRHHEERIGISPPSAPVADQPAAFTAG
jgi:two-component system nitrate/nitrite response regulator NarL